MIQTASIIILVCGILVEIFTLRERYLYGKNVVTAQLFTLVFQGLMFLVYPLLGHIADVCLNRYQTIKCSFALVISGKTAALISVLIDCDNGHNRLESITTTLQFDLQHNSRDMCHLISNLQSHRLSRNHIYSLMSKSKSAILFLFYEGSWFGSLSARDTVYHT